MKLFEIKILNDSTGKPSGTWTMIVYSLRLTALIILAGLIMLLVKPELVNSNFYGQLLKLSFDITSICFSGYIVREAPLKISDALTTYRGRRSKRLQRKIRSRR